MTRFGLGFFLTHPTIPFGPNPRSFGHPGAGGSIGFADPDTKLGLGYVINQMQQNLVGGAHGFALIHAVYEVSSLDCGRRGAFGKRHARHAAGPGPGL